MTEVDGENKFNKQLLGALNAPSVSSRLSDIIKNALINVEKSLHDEVNQKFNELSLSITMLRDEIKTRDALIANLKQDNANLSSQNESLKNQMNELDSLTKRDNLTFSGIDLNYSEVAAINVSDNTAESSKRLVDKIVTICNSSLDIPITEHDISTAYPLTKGSATRPSVVLVKFVRRSIRDTVFLARKKLSSLDSPTRNKIFINEDLSSESRKLLGTLRRMVKNTTLSGAWTRFGKICVKKQDGSIIHVNKLSDLNIPHIPE